jgi:hypothetical protein
MVPKSFGGPDRDVCFFDSHKTIDLDLPQIHPLTIMNRLRLGFDRARFAWRADVTWHFDQLRALQLRAQCEQ